MGGHFGQKSRFYYERSRYTMKGWDFNMNSREQYLERLRFCWWQVENFAIKRSRFWWWQVEISIWQVEIFLMIGQDFNKIPCSVKKYHMKSESMSIQEAWILKKQRFSLGNYETYNYCHKQLHVRCSRLADPHLKQLTIGPLSMILVLSSQCVAN